jgi:leucyl aminopeptidase
MKHILFIFSLFLFISCGAGKTDKTRVSETVSGPNGLTARVVEPNENSETTSLKSALKVFSDVSAVAQSMEFLASDVLKGRDTGSEGIDAAADFIAKRFVAQGIEPYFETYRDTLSNFNEATFNVVGVLEGSDPLLKNEYILVGAHYDHIGLITPEKDDAIANGANDNASGTTTVLEMARYFGKERTNKRSIIFALFSAEEKGLLGSKHLAEKIKADSLDLYVMLNFEMVGVPMVGKDHLVYLTGYELSNMAAISNGYANEKLVGFLPKAKEFSLFKRSDNYAFHTAFNAPSQTFSTFDFTNFEYYHKVGDENEKMDYEHMALVINKMIPVVEGIANAAVKEIIYK